MATFLLNHGQLVLTGFLFQSIPEGNRWFGFIAGHISSLSPIQQSFAHPGLENIAIFSVENVGYMSDIYIYGYISLISCQPCIHRQILVASVKNLVLDKKE